MPVYQKPGSNWLFDQDTNRIVGVKDPDGSERLFSWGSAPGGSQRQYMKTGFRWLYDQDTNRIVGVKDSDGGERFFQFGAAGTNKVYQKSGPWLYDQVTNQLVGIKDPDGGERYFVLTGGAAFAPAFLQASPAGYQGGFRSVTSHTSVCMFKAGCDTTEVEVTVANTPFWTSGGAAEGIPSDGANINVIAQLFVPTKPYSKTLRNFQAGGLLAGATSGTLAANAPSSDIELVEFSNGDLRWVKYNGSATNCSWDAPLTSNCTSTARFWGFTNIGAFPFNGGGSGVLTGGVKSVLQSSLAADVRKGDIVMANFNLTRVGGGTFLCPVSQPANGTDVYGNGLKECYTDSATNYATTRYGKAPFNNPTVGINQFRPVALRGKNRTNTNYMEWVVLGDSIGSLQSGWVAKFLHYYGISHVNYCKAGEFAGSYLANSSTRQQAYGGRGLLIEMGANSWSEAQIKALVAHGRAAGFTKIIQCTAPPNTTVGSTAWTDEASQVANPAIRTVNDLVIANNGLPGWQDDYIDINKYCRGVDPDKWAANFSPEGLHMTGLCIDSSVVPGLIADNVQAKFLAPT